MFLRINGRLFKTKNSIIAMLLVPFIFLSLELYDVALCIFIFFYLNILSEIFIVLLSCEFYCIFEILFYLIKLYRVQSLSKHQPFF